MKSILASGVVLVLVGCAVKPLPDSHYAEMATLGAELESCVSSGHMSPQIGAQGQALLRRVAGQHAVDGERLNNAFALARAVNRDVTASRCRQVAMQIAGVQQQLDEQRSAEPAAPAYTPPRQTYCNRIGNQTLCSSY